MDNLQTLCKTCNSHERLSELNFRSNANPNAVVGYRKHATPAWPPRGDAKSADHLEQHLRRRVNLYFRCAAVESVYLPLRGANAGQWRVVLNPGNDASKASAEFQATLLGQLVEIRENRRLSSPSSISIVASDEAPDIARATPRATAGAKRTTRTSVTTDDGANMSALTVSPQLAAVIGDNAVPHTEVVKKLWVYIKKHNLQDAKNRRMSNADEKLKPVFGGKRQVRMFDMTKLASKHLSWTRRGPFRFAAGPIHRSLQLSKLAKAGINEMCERLIQFGHLWHKYHAAIPPSREQHTICIQPQLKRIPNLRGLAVPASIGVRPRASEPNEISTPGKQRCIELKSLRGKLSDAGSKSTATVATVRVFVVAVPRPVLDSFRRLEVVRDAVVLQVAILRRCDYSKARFRIACVTVAQVLSR